MKWSEIGIYHCKSHPQVMACLPLHHPGIWLQRVNPKEWVGHLIECEVSVLTVCYLGYPVTGCEFRKKNHWPGWQFARIIYWFNKNCPNFFTGPTNISLAFVPGKVLNSQPAVNTVCRHTHTSPLPIWTSGPCLGHVLYGDRRSCNGMPVSLQVCQTCHRQSRCHFQNTYW